MMINVGQATAVVLLFSGIWIHEMGHYLFARVFGGNPEISKWRLKIIPTQVKMDTENMTLFQIRITSGFMLIFIPIAVGALWHQILWLAAFSVGTLAISPRDYIGFFHPEVTKKMNRGEPVMSDDFDDPSVL